MGLRPKDKTKCSEVPRQNNNRRKVQTENKDKLNVPRQNNDGQAKTRVGLKPLDKVQNGLNAPRWYKYVLTTQKKVESKMDLEP